MPFLTLSPPPGVFQNGTLYQASNRWAASSLVRWLSGAMRPVGGWEPLRVVGSEDSPVTAPSDLTDGDWSKGVATTATLVPGPGPDGEVDVSRLEDSSTAYVGSAAQTFSGPGPFTGGVSLQGFIRKRAGAPTAALQYDGTFTSGVGQATAFVVPETGHLRAEASGVVAIGASRVEDAGTWWRVTLRIRFLEEDTPLSFSYTALPALFPPGDLGTGQGGDPTVRGYNDFARLGLYTIAPGSVMLGEPPLGAFAWDDNSGLERLVLGTPTRAWHYAQGGLQDITPSDLTPGVPDAQLASGNYGAGVYGFGPYGTGDPELSSILEAQTWQFDAFGQYLVAHAHSDGRLFSWDLNPSGALAVVPDAPVDNTGVLVTPERFLVALGAGGDPRRVQWADQETLSDWTPTPENQAGDFPLAGGGSILAGRRSRGETLIWTTQDLFSMRYVGPPLVYTFQQLGNNCGPISRRSMTMVDGGKAFWMGRQSFFMYNGFVQPVPSTVSDRVFSDINRLQSSKIHASTLAEFGEVWWYYCSAGSDDIDRYVVYNYQENTWAVGEIERTAAVDRGSFNWPMASDRFGVVYEQEKGFVHTRPNGERMRPWAETGPIEIGSGDTVMLVREYIPDDEQFGSLRTRILGAFYPTEEETSTPWLTPGRPTMVRFTARQVRVRVEQDGDSDWRFGVPRLELISGGRR